MSPRTASSRDIWRDISIFVNCVFMCIFVGHICLPTGLPSARVSIFKTLDTWTSYQSRVDAARLSNLRQIHQLRASRLSRLTTGLVDGFEDGRFTHVDRIFLNHIMCGENAEWYNCHGLTLFDHSLLQSTNPWISHLDGNFTFKYNHINVGGGSQEVDVMDTDNPNESNDVFPPATVISWDVRQSVRNEASKFNDKLLISDKSPRQVPVYRTSALPMSVLSQWMFTTNSFSPLNSWMHRVPFERCSIRTKWTQDPQEKDKGFCSLMPRAWLSGPVIQSFMLTLAKSKGWGVRTMPPAPGQNVWIYDETGVSAVWIMPRGEVKMEPKYMAGVTGDYSPNSPTFRRLTRMQRDELTRRALLVEVALLPLFINGCHWVYGVVNFKTEEILLHDSYGSSAKFDAKNCHHQILEKLSEWATKVQTIRDEQRNRLHKLDPSMQIPGPHKETFDFNVVTSITQRDTYECGVHSSCNIFAVGCGLSGRVNGAVAPSLRSGIALLLWMSSDQSICISKTLMDTIPAIILRHIDVGEQKGGGFRCTPMNDVTDAIAHILQEMQDLMCAQPQVQEQPVVRPTLVHNAGVESLPDTGKSIQLSDHVDKHQLLMHRFLANCPDQGPKVAPFGPKMQGKFSGSTSKVSKSRGKRASPGKIDHSDAHVYCSVSESARSKFESTVDSWKLELPWLSWKYVRQPESDQEVMCLICTLCEDRAKRKKIKPNVFSEGCYSLKKCSVTQHAKIWHQKGCHDQIGANDLPNNADTDQMDIGSSFQTGIDSEEIRVKRIMTECFYIAKKDHSLNSLEARCDLSSYLMDESLGTSYVNNDMAREFMSCIASVVRKDLIADILASSWFSLMLDESYDKGWRAQLMSVVRYLKNGRICTKFYSINELKPRVLLIGGKKEKVTAGSAPSIAHTISDQFSRDGISFKKLAFWATDGASAMLGSKTGMSEYLRQWCVSFALNYHCVAHKHALATAPGFQKPFPMYVEDMMKSVLSYFSKSGKRRTVLSEIQEEMGIQLLGMLKFHQIRWLSKSDAISRCFFNYCPLRRLFESETVVCEINKKDQDGKLPGEDSKLMVLLKEIPCHKFLGSMAAVLDITNQQAEVNRKFQKDIVSYKSVQDAVEFSISELETTYLSQHEIGGARYNKVSSAMRSKKCNLDEAIEKSELKTVENLTEAQLRDLIGDYVESSRTDLSSTSPSALELMHGVRDTILKLKSTSSKNALAKQIAIFETCFAELQMHDLKPQTNEGGASKTQAKHDGQSSETCTQDDSAGPSGEKGGLCRADRSRASAENFNPRPLNSRAPSTLAGSAGKSTGVFHGVRPKPISTTGGHKLYEMECIVETDESEKTMLIKWQGYPSSQNTWEPLCDVPLIILKQWFDRKSLSDKQVLKKRFQSSASKPLFTYSYAFGTSASAVDVIVNEGDHNCILEGAKIYAQDVIDGLKARFPEEGRSILASFDIFHLESMPDDPKKWKKCKDEYGNDELEILIAHYSVLKLKGGSADEQFIEQGECLTQWRIVRNKMWVAVQKNKDKKLEKTEASEQEMDSETCRLSETEVFWIDFFKESQTPPYDFPDIRRLVELFLVIVLSSVHCERFFSQMNLTKTFMRSRMLTDLLNDLLMIKLNAPDCTGQGCLMLKKLIDRAYDLWNAKKRYHKRSRHGPRFYARKVPKHSMEKIKLERPQDAKFDDETFDLETCTCDASKNANNMGVCVQDDVSELKSILQLPRNWSILQQSKLKSEIQDVAQITENNPNFRIAIQLNSGWILNGVCESIEACECPHHYEEYKGWVWVSLLCEGEGSRSMHLCNLDKTNYGMEISNSWCVLKKK